MIPLPAAGSGTAATVRVAGFPTHIRPTFLLLIAIVGWYPGITLPRLAMWVVVASTAVMWHELGHAVAARRLGAEPRIELYGFGGATVWQPPVEPTRTQLIGVSFAGPLAGLILGALTGIGVVVAGGVGTGDVRYLVLVLLWTNVGWSLLNLIPVLPLDGGHILAELLPGDRDTRQRRAAAASVVGAGVAMVVLLLAGVLFGALVLGWVLLTNLQVLQSARASDRRDAAEERARTALRRYGQGDQAALAEVERALDDLRPQSAPFRAVAIETAAAIGDATTARTLLDASPDTEPLPPGLYALVFASESSGREGVVELVELLRREPVGMHARWLAIALRWARRLPELAPILASLDLDPQSAVLIEAAAVAEGFGDLVAARDVRALGGR